MSTFADLDDPSILNNLHWNPFLSILYAKSYYLTTSYPTSTINLSLFVIANNTEKESSLAFSTFFKLWIC